MANLEYLINEAHFAWANITPGSTDEGKHTATAKRVAKRIVSIAPNSPEAIQAEAILRQLGVVHAVRVQTGPKHTNHLPDSPHSPRSHDFSAKKAATSLPFDSVQLLDKYKSLPSGARTILHFAIIAALMFFTGPILVLAVGIFLLRPKLIKDQLKKAFEKRNSK